MPQTVGSTASLYFVVSLYTNHYRELQMKPSIRRSNKEQLHKTVPQIVDILQLVVWVDLGLYPLTSQYLRMWPFVEIGSLQKQTEWSRKDGVWVNITSTVMRRSNLHTGWTLRKQCIKETETQRDSRVGRSWKHKHTLFENTMMLIPCELT